MLKHCLPIIILNVLISVAIGGEQPQDKTATVLGKWDATLLVMDGGTESEERTARVSFHFMEESLAIAGNYDNDRIAEATYSIDWSTKPAQFDFNITAEDDPVECIISVQDNVMKIAARRVADKGGRPETFAAPEGSEIIYLELSAVKAADEKDAQ